MLLNVHVIYLYAYQDLYVIFNVDIRSFQIKKKKKECLLSLDILKVIH
jgi:hypothetical protein